MKNLIFVFACLMSVSVFGQSDFRDVQQIPINESDVKSYFDMNGVSGIEGIWVYSSDYGGAYTVSILKSGVDPVHGEEYVARILEGSGTWLLGDVKAIIKPAETYLINKRYLIFAPEEVVSMEWTNFYKDAKIHSLAVILNNEIIKWDTGMTSSDGDPAPSFLTKIYPK